MRPILIDTNAYSALKRSEASMIDIIQNATEIAISPIVIGELLFGFDFGNQANKNRLELQKFLDSPRVKIYPIQSETAHFFSQISISLRNKGKLIPTNDVWIGAQALENGCSVCTYDKHFEAIDGLHIVTSIADLVL
jgi:predicted nucleic acid-binding protein